MDDRYGRPCNSRMGKSRPGPENRFETRQETCVKTDRGPHRTEGPGMKPGGAARGAETMKMNVHMQRKTDFAPRKDERSPYLANDLNGAGQPQKIRGDLRKLRFYTDSREEMRNRCLDLNRGPRKAGDLPAFGNRGPQTTEHMGTGGPGQQAFEDHMRMKDICDYRNRRPAGRGDQKR